MSKRNKGFTLIELLVVIAIIGILSSVVLASLNTARGKGSDAAVKATMANARAQAELYYDSNTQSYLGVCAAAGTAVPGGVATILAGAVTNSNDANAAVDNVNTTATGATVAVCHDIAGKWAAEMPFKSNGGTTFYCVDYSGKSQTNAAVGLAASDYDC